MKRFWTMLIVALMLCIGFSTVAYATNINHDNPVISKVNFPIMQDSFVSGDTNLPDKIGFSMLENKLYSYAVLPSVYRPDRIQFRCCNFNSKPMINNKSYSAGVRHIAHIKSKITNLRT